MSDWNAGYVSEIEYTHGYYRELCPGLLTASALNVSLRAPEGRPLRYLELGFGQGVSINIHAAANAGEFWGVDFNPAQAAHARHLAEAGGTGAKVLEQSFAELAARDDLPEFDVIALHGIWSWISAENRAVIVDLARRRLRAGGLFYISYNSWPGWAPAMPLRHLLALHAQSAGPQGRSVAARTDEAIAFARKVKDAGALYFLANPIVAERLEQIAKQDRRYLAHEYLNRDWTPMPFSEVAEQLSGAKLTFAASAHWLDHVDDALLPAPGRALLAEAASPVLREQVRDYIVNQQFRRDIFVKGAQRLSPAERQERYTRQRFVLTTLPEDVSMTFAGPCGEARLTESLYRPLLEILAENNYAAKSVAEIVAHPQWKAEHSGALAQCLTILTGLGHIFPAQDPEAVKAAAPRCRKLNMHLIERARHDTEIAFLASPVSGGGVGVSRFSQLFLLARARGQAKSEEAARFAWDILARQGLRLIVEGKTLEGADDNIAELTRQVQAFEKRIPVFKGLGLL